MNQQVAHGHELGGARVAHFKLWQMANHRIIPTDPSLIDEQCERGGDEGLAVGSDTKERLCIDGCTLSERPNAISSHQRRFARTD